MDGYLPIPRLRLPAWAPLLPAVEDRLLRVSVALTLWLAVLCALLIGFAR